MSAVKLRLAVHIRRDANGALEGTLDSLDQNANGLPLAAVTAAADTLAFTVPVINGSYSAKWDAAAGQWVGEWRQAGMGLPLILAPGGPAPLPASAPPALPANWQIPADAEIAALIDARIANRPGEGIVVGVIDASGRRIVARGPAGGPAFDGKTLFEIGSMTKVFTGLVLADMVEHGEVALDDPAANYLPAGATLPERGGRRITLIDLATHRSGLPRLPGNLPMHDPRIPTPTTRSRCSSPSSRATGSRATSAANMNIRTSRSGCSAICSRTAPGPIMRRWWRGGSSARSG